MTLHVDMDFTANGGTGEATVSWADATLGTPLQEIAGLTDISMGLDPFATDGTNVDNWNAVYASFLGAGGALDNIGAEIPEPGAALIFALAAFWAVRRRKRIAVAAAMGALVCTISFAPSPSIALPIDTSPDSLNAGDQYRLVFVTSTTRNANATNINTYNNFVSSAANAVLDLAALGTSWSAIGSSDAVDARNNTETNPGSDGAGVPIFLLDGVTMVAGGEYRSMGRCA